MQKHTSPIIRQALQNAIAFQRSNQISSALDECRKILAIDPYNLDALFLCCVCNYRMGRIAEALKMINELLRIHNNNAQVFNLRGVVFRSLGQSNDALSDFNSAIKLKTDYADAYYNKGNALRDLGQISAALESYERALAFEPHRIEFINNLAGVHSELSQHQKALMYYQLVAERNPKDSTVRQNQALVLARMDRFEEALGFYDLSVELNPLNAEAFSGRGDCLREMGRLNEALESCNRSITINPQLGVAHCSRGNVLAKLKLLDEALASYNIAINCKPNYAQAHSNRGYALKELNRLDEALASYDRAIELKPDLDNLIGDRLHTRMLICDWSNFANERKLLETAVENGRKAISPFAFLSLCDHPELHLKAARKCFSGEPILDDYMKPKQVVAGSPKIRIGYYSADWHNHATSYLMAELLEEHNKENFEVYGFSFGPKRHDQMRKRLLPTFKEFHDVNGISDREIAVLSRELGINIAIDLKGYTKDARSRIFAYRAAPIQVNYLGYPGTMGAPYIDYIIADNVLIPPETRHCFDEKIVYLPDSYQANDSKKEISTKVFTRVELGLPDDGFVFCCFNNTYKILPDIFDAWMRVLMKLDCSVLWLFEHNDVVAQNLRAEASRRGVNPERLVFANRMPLDEHLARLKFADLFLDTHPYNAHTTASDALWAGLPVLTCIGKSFAARVAASLLTALDMEELVVDTMQEYEDMAFSLASDPNRLSAIKEKLARNRITSNLFNGRAFARNIEAAYKEMFKRYQSGLPPDDIIVSRHQKYGCSN